MFVDNFLLTRMVLLSYSSTISLIDNIVEQVFPRINLLKITYNNTDIDIRDMVTSILSKRSNVPFSLETLEPTFCGDSFLNLIFVDHFEDLK